jgi:hypothetical protein
VGGYQANTVALRVHTGAHVTDLASSVDLVETDLDGVGRLSPPLAGQSIAGTLTTVVKAWFDVVPSVAKELELLGGAVKTSATMMEKVEAENTGRFGQFSR